MNKIFLSALILCLPVLGISSEKPFGRVVDTKGTSFLSYKGQVKEIKSGDILYPDSEVFVEASGQVSFTDNAEHRFHLSSSSSVLLKYGDVELRNGQLWIQSINPSDVFELTSANAKVFLSAGEGVFSYDSLKGKSQLLVINGMMKFANLRKSELNLHVGEGHFSFIDPEFDAGNPRTPTTVGNKTFRQMIANYTGVETLDRRSHEVFKNNDLITPAATARGIASVNVLVPRTATRTAKRVSETPKMQTIQKGTFKKVEINFYGLKGVSSSPTTAMFDMMKVSRTRMPASVPPTEIGQETIDTLDVQNENPIIQHYKESDTLIERLKGL